MYARTVLMCLALAAPAGTFAQAVVVAPISDEQRLQEYLRSLSSPFTALRVAAGAGISQWRDRPEEWEQGGSGYAKRAASSYAQHAVGVSILYGVSSLLGEDNRYIRSGLDGKGDRIKYAVGSTFLARVSDGRGGTRRRVSFSRIAAVAGGAFLSRAWQPESTRGPGTAVKSMGISFGVISGFNVAREFFRR